MAGTSRAPGRGRYVRRIDHRARGAPISGTTRPRARQGRRTVVALVTAFAAGAALASGALGAVSPTLAERLETASPDERLPVIVGLRDQLDAGSYEGRPGALLLALRRVAARSRDDIEDSVHRPTRHFWLVNAHALRATPEEIEALAADPDVSAVDLDPPVRTLDAGESAVPDASPGRGNWGLAAIGVPRARAASGTSGEGVVVGSIDTGVDASHPLLAGRVTVFRDFVSGRGEPYDDNGHGTHTLGTIIGAATADGAPIGVAPRARAVVAKAMDGNGAGSGSTLLAAAQWMTDPDGDPSTHDQPDVINNSWSASGPNDPWFRQMIRRWTELGIVPVFAVGNTGPGASSVGSPASYPEAIAVGALAESGEVPSFSARGPIVWQNIDELGPAAGTPLTKPDLAAPGVGIAGAAPGGFLTFTGTSMASPHVAGVVALMREASPNLSPDAIAHILRSTAQDVGAPGADPDAGYGRVDALGALAAAAGPAPETTLVHTPASATRARAPTYGVAVERAGQVRYRVDRGPWSPAVTGPVVAVPIRSEGHHRVEFQAISASGPLDPTPAVHRLTVDRTRPEVRIVWRRAGDRATFMAVTDDDLSAVRMGRARWGLGRGVRKTGSRAHVRFAEAGRRRIRVDVADAAGNHARATRTFVPTVTTPIRRLRVSARRATARRGWVSVSGRLLRPAGLRAVLRPIASLAPSEAGASASERRAGSPARRATGRRRRGGFSLRLPTRRLTPGLYRVELRAVGRRRSSPPIVRVVRVRG